VKRQIVIDSSVIAKLFFHEDLSNKAIEFIKYSIKSDWQLLAPNLIDYEIGNICWKRIKRKELQETEAVQVLENYRKLIIAKIEVLRFVPEILSIAVKANITFYDSSYLYLAVAMNSKFITADAILVKSVQQFFPEDIIGLKNLNIANLS
jgi:predicted nucleic acid-binding protein